MSETIKRYSNQSLVLTSKGSNKPIKVTASSSLMTNYEPARAVDAEERIKPIQDKNGDPIIFSVGTTNHLYVVLKDKNKSSGWAQYDVSNAIDADAKVAAFNAYNLPNDTFVLAVALVKNKTVRFLVTPPLSTDPAAGFWQNLHEQLKERPNDIQLQDVADIRMGVSDDESLPMILVNATKDGTNYDRYRVKADVNNFEEIWKALPIPQNAHSTDGKNAIIDTAIGKLASLGLAGTYTLYRVGQELALTFDTVEPNENLGGQIISRDMKVPARATALATVVADSDGNTDLFVAGDAIYRFPAAQQEETDDAQKITGEISGGDDTELAVLVDDENFAVWFLDDGVLNYVHGKRSGDPSWSTPMPIAKDIGQIAALRNTIHKANEIFSVSADNELMYQFQDPRTTIWNKVAISLPDTGKAIPFSGYTTVIHFEDDRDAPIRPVVHASASSWVYATINGKHHILDVKTAVPIFPDGSGTVTIITKSTTASCPVISFSSDDFEEVLDINPQHVVNESLKAFAAPGKLTDESKTQDGELVVPEGSNITADQLSKALGTLTSAADAAHSSAISIRNSSNQGHGNKVDIQKFLAGSSQSVGMAYQDGRSLLHYGKDALGALKSVGESAISGMVNASFGDVWNAISNGLKKVGAWVLEAAEDGLKFIVRLADGIATFVLDTLEKIYEALTWVLDQVKMALEKLIKWVGQMLGWDDILKCQKIIANGVNKMLDWTIEETGYLQGKTKEAFDSIAKKLTNQPLPDDIRDLSLSGAAGKKKNDNKGKAEESDAYKKSPAGGFAKYHINHSANSGQDISIGDILSKAIDDFIKTAKQAGKNISGTVKAILKEIQNGINDDSMSIMDILSIVLDKAILGSLKTINDLIIGMLEIVADIIQLIKAIINEKFEIPFLSGFFRTITDGEELTILNIISLLVAVPTTIMVKLFGGGAIFDHAPAGMMDKQISPKDYMALINPGGSPENNLRPVEYASYSSDSGSSNSPSAGDIYSVIGGAVNLITAGFFYGFDIAVASGPPGSKELVPKPIKIISVAALAITTFLVFPIPKDNNTGFSYITDLLPWIYGLFPLTIAGFSLAAPDPGIEVLDEVLGVITPIVCIVFAAGKLFDSFFSGGIPDATLGLVANLGAGIGTYSLLWATFMPTPEEKVVCLAVAGICLLGVKTAIDGIGEVKLIAETA